jgi:Ca2+-transporting ATPase
MIDLKRGLSTEQVKNLQLKYGKNELQVEKKEGMLKKVFHAITEPMFLLLIIAAVIYFILGEPRDGAIMLIFVVGIICIEVIQEVKTDKTLSALKDLSAPQIKVIRGGEEQIILSADLVPGDLMIISEGVKIPADGTVVSVSSLSIFFLIHQ